MNLPAIWFGLLGVLLAGYAVLDGFDFGVGILHPLARGDRERRLFVNSIGPLWDGNEVWLVTFGGALFAMFPEAYATVFSGFYMAIVLLLFAIQICSDFAGYTDIARGTSRILGIDLMENFKHPYFATSVTGFWRRWLVVEYDRVFAGTTQDRDVLGAIEADMPANISHAVRAFLDTGGRGGRGFTEPACHRALMGQ